MTQIEKTQIEKIKDEIERIRKELISFVNKYYGEETKKEVLAYLEKQKEQQPAEWSEEDNNALVLFHELISFGYTERFCDAQTAEDMRRWLNERLKSTRPQPHWKPSDEQMIALRSTMYDYEDVSWYNTLASLYDDLKKLL